jgi:hypothetical protein
MYYSGRSTMSCARAWRLGALAARSEIVAEV